MPDPISQSTGSGPQLTIILPSYNGEQTIRETIDSLLRQTSQAFRILFVDDGSDDDTTTIVKSMMRPSDGLIEKSNSGLYDTLNFAVSKVSTKWTAFIFQDDLAAPTYVESTLNFINDNSHVNVFWYAIDIISERSETLFFGPRTGHLTSIEPGASAWRDALRRGTFWTISGSVGETNAFANCLFRPDLPHCGDYDFLLRALWRFRFTYIHSSLVSIRQHSGQASSANLASGRDFDERFQIYIEQRAAHREAFSGKLRFQLGMRLASLIVLRAGGRLRRGRPAMALRHARQLLKVLLWALVG